MRDIKYGLVRVKGLEVGQKPGMRLFDAHTLGLAGWYVNQRQGKVNGLRRAGK